MALISEIGLQFDRARKVLSAVRIAQSPFSFLLRNSLKNDSKLFEQTRLTPMTEYSASPEFHEAMKGYMDEVDGGHREIFKIV